MFNQYSHLINYWKELQWIYRKFLVNQNTFDRFIYLAQCIEIEYKNIILKIYSNISFITILNKFIT